MLHSKRVSGHNAAQAFAGRGVLRVGHLQLSWIMSRNHLGLSLSLLGFVLAGGPRSSSAQAVPATGAGESIAATYRGAADSLIHAATRDSAAYTRLGKLVDTFGSRLSGSAGLEAAIDWILGEMKSDGLQNVRGEPVMVPHWVRGEESAELVKPRRTPLHMLGLGGSVATPKGGITAPVLVVTSFDDLTRRAGEARGKIVLFDAPFTTYRETVHYRVEGASAAARVGAVASLIRSVSSYSIQNPHTGVMHYDSTVARIPAAALSVEDAMMLRRFQDRGVPVVLTLRMSARLLPDARSRNVVAELVGRERPDEVVVLGGTSTPGMSARAPWTMVAAPWPHGRRCGSWAGSGSGPVARCGWCSGPTRRMAVADPRPTGTRTRPSSTSTRSPWSRTTGYSARTAFGSAVRMRPSRAPRRLRQLLKPIGAGTVSREQESPEADIAPLVERGVPGMGLDVDRTRYFWFHHSAGDTLDKLDPAEVARCVATLAVMAYVVADLPDSLPRATTP